MRNILIVGAAIASFAAVPAHAAATISCPGGDIVHGCSFDDTSASGSFYDRIESNGSATAFDDIFQVTLGSAGDVTITLTNTPAGMTFSDLLFDGEIFSVGTAGTTFTRGPGTYELRLIGSTTRTGSYSGTIDFVAGAVPEPATWAMMIAGFGLVGASLRQRKQKLSVTFA